jgi:hypothetical protein
VFEVFQISEPTATRRRAFFHAVDATDGITAETGLTGTGRVSKNGAATAGSSASITEIDSTNMPGRYYIEFTTSELDTAGQFVFRYKNAACAEVIVQATVVNFDPYAAGPTIAEIVDGVWDELRASHVTAGTFGQGAASVQGNVTGSVDSVTGAVGSVTGAVGSVTGNVGGNVTGSIGSVAASGIAAASFAAGAVDANALAADAGTEIATAVFARAFSAAYGSYTFDELVKMFAAVLLGKVSGMATGSPIFRNLADSANVVSATTDADGNRSVVTRVP